MLINKIKETSKLIDLEERINELKKQSDNIDIIDKRFSKVNKQLNNYVVSIGMLNERDKDIFEFRDLNTLQNKIKKFKMNLSNDYYDTELLYSISSNIDELERELQLKWSNYFVEEVTSLRNTIISVKEITRDQQGANIVLTALNPNKGYWPIDERTINIINENISSGKKIIEELGLNSKIEEFLTKISGNEATILDLDSEILEWLKSKGLENKISLKFNN